MALHLLPTQPTDAAPATPPATPHVPHRATVRCVGGIAGLVALSWGAGLAFGTGFGLMVAGGYLLVRAVIDRRDERAGL